CSQFWRVATGMPRSAAKSFWLTNKAARVAFNLAAASGNRELLSSHPGLSSASKSSTIFSNLPFVRLADRDDMQCVAANRVNTNVQTLVDIAEGYQTLFAIVPATVNYQRCLIADDFGADRKGKS